MDEEEQQQHTSHTSTGLFHRYISLLHHLWVKFQMCELLHSVSNTDRVCVWIRIGLNAVFLCRLQSGHDSSVHAHRRPARCPRHACVRPSPVTHGYGPAPSSTPAAEERRRRGRRRRLRLLALQQFYIHFLQFLFGCVRYKKGFLLSSHLSHSHATGR